MTDAAADPPADPVVAAYLARRPDLLRYFRVRLRSPGAAEDLVQDMYLKILKRPDEMIDNPAAFLYRLGSNLMLDRIKQDTRMRRRATAWNEVHGNPSGGELAGDEPPADQALAARDQLQRIIRAVKDLPALQQEAFRLHKLEGLSHAQTAETMGVSRSSIEKYLMACLKHIHAKVIR